MKNTDARNLTVYFILTYALFWVLLVCTGLAISLDAPKSLIDLMKTISSWSPTLVVLLLFKRLYPGTTFRKYLKSQFSGMVRASTFIVTLVLQLSLVILAVAALSIVNSPTPSSISFVGIAPLIPALFSDLTTGATGEEIGWRGYALNTLQKQHSPLKASLILGIIWGLWHLPLMLLSGEIGIDLVIYMAAFLVAILSFSVIITFFYNKSRNILIAMWLHLCFNFSMKIFAVDLLALLQYVSAAYFVAAVFVVAFHRKEMATKQPSEDHC